MILETLLYAQAQTSPQPQPSPIGAFFPLILIFVIFYFLLIRPQQKQIKKHQEMVASLKKGDKIITSGGIVGTIQKIDGDEIVITTENTSLRIRKNSVTSIKK
ncbi:MAG: preprotein translocase subunit YajC [Elusimicrobia bacterium]|nr:preprotein translocase subunit YajC [Elusimicrobiota bacterium]